MIFFQATVKTTLVRHARWMSTGKSRDAIGLIGLGQMGSGMARNLALKSTKPVYVYDVNYKATQALCKEFPQLKKASSPLEVARQTSTLITMLPSTDHVEKMYEEVASDLTDAVWVDSSTIDTEAVRKLAKRVQAKGGWLVDAPVSGGVAGAQAGTLTFMVGAPDAEVFDRIKPVLQWMGKSVTYCGESGAGQICKVCNNMLLSIHMMGVSEAMILGTRLGMDPSLLNSVLSTSTGKCWSAEACNPYPGVVATAPASREYTGGFSNKLMAKDLRLAMKAAKDVDFSPPLGSLSSKVYQTLESDKEFNHLDFSSVLKWISKDK
ncbi:3-hydroxyisobutyrate dehydrogenase [Sporodiniella umbellata]|nr:3-hydroxyisobutyrate dehydrogenase [Sporodiniella umbellata]